jgi:hypothetical protein
MAIRETLSTLKFAERAKKIKNKAVVNEESNDKYFQKKYNDLVKEMELMKQGYIPAALSDPVAPSDDYPQDFQKLSILMESV